MTPEEWIEEFTGLKSDGTVFKSDLDRQVKEADDEAIEKRKALKESRDIIALVKAELQLAMQFEVKLKKSFFDEKQKTLLAVNGTQTDEADFTEIDFFSLELSPESKRAINTGFNKIASENERLKALEFKRSGVPEPLFSKKEIADEFWTPLVRERIMPESLVANHYSQTQHMLDETNALYKSAIADKKEQDKLTAALNIGREAVGVLAELTLVGASLATKFGGNIADAKRAADILNLVGEGIRTSGQVYDKVKEKQFTDAASLALDSAGILSEIILKQKGFSSESIEALKTGFKIGDAAIAAGKAFASGDEDRISRCIDSMGSVLQSSLRTAALGTSDIEKKKRLEDAAATVPLAFKAEAIRRKIMHKVADADVGGVLDCLSTAAKSALVAVKDVQTINATSGLSDESADKIVTANKKAKLDITQDINLALLSGNMLVAMSTLARKGDHLKALNALIQNVGKGLESVLTKAGVGEEQSQQIAGIYKAASSSAAILEALTNNPPKVADALSALGIGIVISFKTAAGDNEKLLRVGDALNMGISGLGAMVKIEQQYAEGKFDEGIQSFSAAIQSQVESAFNIKDMKTVQQAADDAAAAAAKPLAPESMRDKDGILSIKAAAEERTRREELVEKTRKLKELDFSAKAPQPSTVPLDPNASLNKTIQRALRDIGELAGKAQKDIEAGLVAANAKEFEEIIAQAQADSLALTDPQLAGIDASKIDQLIAKLERDRILWEMATKIVEGSSEFLATFVPGLGAAGMAMRLAANMVAAGERLQNFLKWSESQRDFEAAQNELASSSQNFVKNQRNQLIHHTLQAVFGAASMIGELMSVTVVVTAAGVGLRGVAAAASKIESIVNEKKNKYDLEKAWKTTQAAFANPGNRRLGLHARALNPTLAKYAIAWGAVIKKDPLARNALAACQLNEATLANEDTNVSKVVDYLEHFHFEDDKLYRELATAAVWLPTEIDLSMKSWMNVKLAVIKQAKLKGLDTGNIDGLLVLLTAEVGSLDKAGLIQRVTSLNSLTVALKVYVPVTSVAEVDKSFKEVCQLLRTQVGTELTMTDKQLKLLIEGGQTLRETVDRLDICLGKVEACANANELTALRALLVDAGVVIQACANDPLLVDKEIQSQADTLKSKSDLLTKLIVEMETKIKATKSESVAA